MILSRATGGFADIYFTEFNVFSGANTNTRLSFEATATKVLQSPALRPGPQLPDLSRNTDWLKGPLTSPATQNQAR